MDTEFIKAAMQDAVYEWIPGDGQYYREIPGLQGVWAAAESLEQCRRELREVLEDWLVLGIQLGHDIPSIHGISLATSRGSQCPS